MSSKTSRIKEQSTYKPNKNLCRVCSLQDYITKSQLQSRKTLVDFQTLTNQIHKLILIFKLVKKELRNTKRVELSSSFSKSKLPKQLRTSEAFVLEIKVSPTRTISSTELSQDLWCKVVTLQTKTVLVVRASTVASSMMKEYGCHTLPQVSYLWLTQDQTLMVLNSS